MTFPTDPATPIADSIGEVPHMIPEPLARRLRSAACLAGDGDCADPMCLCTCHIAAFSPVQVDPGPEDYYLKRVLSGLDTIIAQVPGSYPGFSVPPPYYPPDLEAGTGQYGASR